MRASAHKYHAIPMEIAGIRFASRKEGRRYQELCLLQAAGAIAELTLQPEFAMTVLQLHKTAQSGWPLSLVTVGTYRADFSYTDLQTGELKIEDVKGFRTPLYLLKRKLVESIHGVSITEL